MDFFQEINLLSFKLLILDDDFAPLNVKASASKVMDDQEFRIYTRPATECLKLVIVWCFFAWKRTKTTALLMFVSLYKNPQVVVSVLMKKTETHYNDVIKGTIASQITSLAIVYSTVYSDGDQRKHQSSASLAFVLGIHRGPVNSPHKGPVTRKMFPFYDVITDTNLTPVNPS